MRHQPGFPIISHFCRGGSFFDFFKNPVRGSGPPAVSTAPSPTFSFLQLRPRRHTRLSDLLPASTGSLRNFFIQTNIFPSFPYRYIGAVIAAAAAFVLVMAFLLSALFLLWHGCLYDDDGRLLPRVGPRLLPGGRIPLYQSPSPPPGPGRGDQGGARERHLRLPLPLRGRRVVQDGAGVPGGEGGN